MKDNINITISCKRYKELLDIEAHYWQLRVAGVDNWDGYEPFQPYKDESEEDIYGD